MNHEDEWTDGKGRGRKHKTRRAGFAEVRLWNSQCAGCDEGHVSVTPKATREGGEEGNPSTCGLWASLKQRH
jgi:hypothetical protein